MGFGGGWRQHCAEEQEVGWSRAQEGERGRNQIGMDGAEEWRGGGGLEHYDGVPPPSGPLMVDQGERLD